MNIVTVIQVLLYLFLVWFCITQVIMPTIEGRPMFPAFRRKEKLQQELERAREARDEKNLEREIEKHKSDMKE